MNRLSMLQDSRTNNTSSLSGAIQTSQPKSGGLWTPIGLPMVTDEEMKMMSGMTYRSIASVIFSKFDFGIPKEEIEKIIDASYGKQWHHAGITPVTHITDNLYSLHLGYGPTFAFKNVALEFLPRLLSAMTKDKIINVLGASSGDTINAAHSGVRGTNIRSLFMLPATGPSAVQRLQAVGGIVDNPNAFTLLADAPFDPLQEIVKKINTDPAYSDFKEEHNITSFNSINIARILAQVVYYFRAYAQLMFRHNMEFGKKVIFSVPSGNFGDALAAYYALKMGLPIDKIMIATNENDMLHRFIQTGRYEPPRKDGKDYVEVTNAPSMDIAKSSNFERMLFDMVDGDAAKVNGWYQDLSKNGYFQVDAVTLKKIQEIFVSSSSTNEERENAIRQFGGFYNHGIDPHTAAAVVPWIKERKGGEPWDEEILTNNEIPVIFLETSHVAQFTEELQAKGIIVPGMNEFDATLDRMRNADTFQGNQFLNTGNSFETIFPDIRKVMEEIFPKRF